MDKISYYSILGVKEDAPVADIKTAYRRAARANHPDSGAPGAGALFPLIQEAWDVLGDESKRSKYDRERSAPSAAPAPAPSPVKEPQKASYGPSEADRDRVRREYERRAAEQRNPAPTPTSFPASSPTPTAPLSEQTKSAPRQSLMIAGSIILWAVWGAICAWLIKGIGQDGVLYAFLSFFPMFILTFLLVKFSKDLNATYAFIFGAITLPLPVTGLVTVGWSSTSWIFVIFAVGIAASLGDHFMRRPAMRRLRGNSREYQAA